MNEDSYRKTCEELLNSYIKRISDWVIAGYTKGQISEFFHKRHEAGADENVPVEAITILNDVTDRLIDTAIYLHAKNNLQPEIKKIYQQLDDEKNLSYIGKDGRDYYSKEALEEANKQYMDQMYSENKPRTM